MVMAYVVMAYVVMAYVALAYTVVPHIVMAERMSNVKCRGPRSHGTYSDGPCCRATYGHRRVRVQRAE